jgi:hypothetical protein
MLVWLILLDHVFAGCRKRDRRGVHAIDLQYVVKRAYMMLQSLINSSLDLDRIEKDAALGNSPLFFGGTYMKLELWLCFHLITLLYDYGRRMGSAH